MKKEAEADFTFEETITWSVWTDGDCVYWVKSGCLSRHRLHRKGALVALSEPLEVESEIRRRHKLLSKGEQ